MNRGTIAALCVIVAGAAVSATALRPPDILSAISNGWLPEWYTVDDRWFSVSKKEFLTYYVYDCLVDTSTGSTWVIRSKRIKRRQLLEGEIDAEYSTPRTPVTTTDIRVCFPDYMPPPTNLTFTPNP